MEVCQPQLFKIIPKEDIMKQRTIKILMIEDNMGDAMLISEMLKETKNKHLILHHNVQLSSGIERLNNTNYDVILLDLGLPDSLGLDTLRRLYSRIKTIPIIILTGMDDEELGYKAVKMGAQDFLIKGQIDCNLLLRSIRYSIERKKTEEIIREKEERFRATFEQAAVGIAHVTLGGEWLMVNKKFCEIVGCPHDKLLNLSLSEITHPDDLEYDARQKELVINGNLRNYQMEKRFIRRDNGSVVCTNFTGSIVKNETGKPLYFIIVIEDITGRKQVEIALQEIALKLSTVFRESPSGIAISTLNDGKYLDINEAFENITGFRRDEVIGNTASQLEIFSDLRDREKISGLLSKKGAVKNMEVKLKRKSGSSLIALISVVQIELGKRSCILSIFNDITEHKKKFSVASNFA